MAITPEEINIIISKSLPNAKINIVDYVGDNNHYIIHVMDDSFKNKSLIEQHRIIKDALKAVLNNQALHAVTIKTSCASNRHNEVK